MNSTVPARRPAPLSAGLAVVVALGTVVLLTGDQTVAVVLVECVGFGVVSAGVVGYRRGWHTTGGIGVLAGAGIIGGAIVWGAVTAGGAPEAIKVLPGYVGGAVIFLGVLPVYGSGARWLVKAGAGFVLAGVLVTALLNSAGLEPLLIATAGSVVAWDLAENAINVGEQLGRETTTMHIEGVHALGTVVVAAVAVEGVQLARGWNPAEASLSVLLVLLLAVIAFTVALHD